MSSLQRANYAKIPLEKRQALIKLVIQQQMSIAKAGRKLELKPSTAKLIVRKYRQTGSFFVKKGLSAEQEEIQASKQLHYGNSTNFGERTFCVPTQQHPFDSNNAFSSQGFAMPPQSNFYLVYPIDYSNFVVYY